MGGAGVGFDGAGTDGGPDVPRASSVGCSYGGARVTLIWFIVWLVANNVGAHEPLEFDPVNAWTGTLILALALDVGSSHAYSNR